MSKGIKIIICVLLSGFLLLSLPVLYICGMAISIGYTHGADSDYLPMLIAVSVVVLLLDIIGVIGLIKILKQTERKDGGAQAGEALESPDAGRKYLRNRWFAAPLVLPCVSFVLNAAKEFMFWLMYDANITQHTRELLDPYFTAFFALGTLSGVLYIFAAVPLVIAGIVLAVIKRITLGEMLVSFGINLIAFLFAAISIAGRA